MLLSHPTLCYLCEQGHVLIQESIWKTCFWVLQKQTVSVSPEHIVKSKIDQETLNEKQEMTDIFLCIQPVIKKRVAENWSITKSFH